MKKPGQIRIIGGTWRGRKLMVPLERDVRPTPDRIRETLFNWLAMQISGAYCLDLFAGSGVLGFEASSRGAAAVLLVDQSAAVVQLLRDEIIKFQAENVQVLQAKVPEQLTRPARPYDIVFLDPPYQQNLLLPCCFYLEENGFLADNAAIYLETDHLLKASDLPANWALVKSKKAGQVGYHLAMRQSN